MISLVLTFLLSSPSIAGPILVRNGAGESEFSLVLVRERLSTMLAVCDGACALKLDEMAVLSQLKARAGHPPLANFAALNGAPVYAFSANGQTVTFNQDALWLDVQKTQSLKAPDALRIWIKILSEIPPQLPSMPTAFLSNHLTEKVEKSWITLRSIEETGAFFEVLTFRDSVDQILVRDASDQILDVTAPLLKSIDCVAGLRSWQIHSVNWNRVVSEADGSKSARLDLISTWTCASASERGRALIDFKTEPAPSYKIDPGSLRVRRVAE